MLLTVPIAILGGDMRQHHLARLLQRDGLQVLTCGVPELPDTYPGSSPVHTFLLPMPAFTSDGRIRGGTALQLLTSHAGPGDLVFGGMLAPQAKTLQTAGLQLYDYAGDETLVLENAALTAEAAVYLLLQQMQRPIAGSQILITGFGRIARFLGERLAALHAAVTVTSRSSAGRTLGRLYGYQTADTGKLPPLVSFDAIVNTVPAQILSSGQLAQLDPDCLLLELASLPGGFPPEAEALPNYLCARGLPGKYAPKAAAIFIRDAVFRSGLWKGV